jgi:hypothetical protein
MLHAGARPDREIVMHAVQCPSCKQLIRRPPSSLSLALCPSCGALFPQRRHVVSDGPPADLLSKAVGAAEPVQASHASSPTATDS